MSASLESAANGILAKLVEWQLQPQLLQGQAYDGSGAIAGKSKGKVPQGPVYTLCIPQAKSLCYEMLHNLGSEQHDSDCRHYISLFQ